jgi:hypothetical protein
MVLDMLLIWRLKLNADQARRGGMLLENKITIYQIVPWERNVINVIIQPRIMIYLNQ